MVAALAGYDFATVFRRIRTQTGWSQQTLGALVGLDQGRVSAIERGVRRLRDIAVVARVATFLCIPPILLGFGACGTTVGEAGVGGPKVVSWVERRDFVQHVGALTLGAGAAGLDIDRLVALLPQAEPTGTRHIGLADVEAIEQATGEFQRQDFAQGSGLSQAAAVAQVHAVLPRLGARATTPVRSRLLVATADLAKQAGWMSFGVNQHDAARRLWLIGLDVARAAGDPRGSDLTVFLLYDMALQAVSLGRPKEALQLTHLGHAAAAGQHRVSGATLSCLASIQARAHAAQGDAAGCDLALGQAVEHFAAVNQASSEPWVAFHDETSLRAYQGAAQYELALTGRDPSAAGRAVPLLRRSVDGVGAAYTLLGRGT